MVFRRRKPDKQKTHQRIWWSLCLRSSPGTAWGGAPKDLGTSRTFRPDFCVKSTQLDRIMSAGQMGHVRGTNGTRPRDGRNPNVEVSRPNSFCLLVFAR